MWCYILLARPLPKLKNKYCKIVNGLERVVQQGTSVDLIAYLYDNSSSGVMMWGDFWEHWGHFSEKKKCLMKQKT
jgi:hypothetical protein